MEKNAPVAIAVEPKPAALEVAKPVISFAQAHQLAETYGTPLLVYSREHIRENYWVLKNAMPKVDLYYAVKANYESCILETILQEGGFVDICSTGELKKTLETGFSVEQMIHTHPCKTMDNLQICHEAGVRWFTFDCVSEAEKMLNYSADYNLILRLKASGENSLINLSAKFGCAIEEVEELVDQTMAMGGTIKGLAFHVGSQCTDTKDYLTMLRRVRQVWDMCIEKGCPLEILDIGGGFPAPYREPIISLKTFAEQVYSHLEATFGDTNARFVAEPGRGLAARNATLITKVLGKNVRSGDTWYFIDEGLYGCFSGVMFDHVQYELLYEERENPPLKACIVAGPTCDSSDIISRKEHLLPDLAIGELLLAPTMGAYTHSTAAAFFNGLPPAKVIVLD
jgi:ornithine decarboxylase